MKEILENILETAYKEYKEYHNFLTSIAPEIKERRESFIQFAQGNPTDISTLTNKLFENESITSFYEKDLLQLQNTLRITYNNLKDVLEVPPEVKKEVEEFFIPQQIFKIEKGEPTVIDPESFEKTKKEAKSYYENVVKDIVKVYGK